MNFNIRCLIPLLTVVTLAITVRATLQTSAPVIPSWKAHDMSRKRPPVVIPGTSALPVSAPSDAVVLFDGKDLRNWRNEDREDPKWIVRNGYMESVKDSGYLQTEQSFGDIQLHIEWMTPAPPEGTGQDRGNSGVFLMGLYEVQVLDSYKNITYADGQAAAIYGQYPPMANVSLPPGEWQSYDIVFRRPRFNQNGTLLQPGRLTVFHNGVLVQDAVDLWGPTAWLQHEPYKAHPDQLPLSLQDHGNPVRYRNIWARKLTERPENGPDNTQDRSILALPDSSLDCYVGRYRATDREFTIIRKESRLEADINGNTFLELVPHSKTEFSLRWTAGTLIFKLDKENNPLGAIFSMGGKNYIFEKYSE